MAKNLDGKKFNEEIAARLKKQFENLPEKLKLAILQVGDLKESNNYIKHKVVFAEKIGILVEHKQYKEDVEEQEIISAIEEYNSDISIGGIVVQLPIPEGLNKYRIIESIDPRKDVDGITSTNINLLFNGKLGLVPATAKGVVSLLEKYGVNLVGVKAVVVGESALVGRPIALALLNKKATVTVCHTHTKNLAGETRLADVLVVAAGYPGLITASHVSRGQVVIDVGISVAGGQVLGDVDYENVKKVVGAITPVPGGVGPMTVASLFQNLLEAKNSQT